MFERRANIQRSACSVCHEQYYCQRVRGPGYCSDACRKRVSRSRRPPENPPRFRPRCDNCGLPFSAVMSTAKVCSSRCRLAAHLASTTKPTVLPCSGCQRPGQVPVVNRSYQAIVFHLWVNPNLEWREAEELASAAGIPKDKDWDLDEDGELVRL